MIDHDQRIASLSPERRQLLEALRARHAVAARAPQPASAPSTMQPLSALTGEKAKTKLFYDSVNEQLDPTPFGEFSCFLNYGFVSDGSREFSVVTLPEHYLNRNSVKLVLEVIGKTPLEGKSVLDVGCGRGGTVVVLHTFFRPCRIAALDLSSRAVRFCRRTHRYPEATFVEGDAEHLPYESDSFDAVINIESSHLYPEIAAFYGEVFRALRPGGSFLYADLQSAARYRDCLALLRQTGLIIERERDITNNVLLSCDQIAQQRVQAYQSPTQEGMLGEFLGAPGSQVYQELSLRSWGYYIVTARKP